MTRPPLYVRRPFLAGLIRQLPLLAVLLTVGLGLLLVTFQHWRWGLVVIGLALIGAGLLLVTFEHWRRGLVVVGLALVGAALLRLLLPVRRVGFLAVRSRPLDVALLAGTGVALTVIVLLIPFP